MDSRYSPLELDIVLGHSTNLDSPPDSKAVASDRRCCLIFIVTSASFSLLLIEVGMGEGVGSFSLTIVLSVSFRGLPAVLRSLKLSR